MSTAILLKSYFARPLGVGLASQLFLMNHNKACCESSRLSSTLASVVDKNPLLDQSSVPKFDQIQPGHVVPAVKHDLQRLQTDFKGNFIIYYLF